MSGLDPAAAAAAAAAFKQALTIGADHLFTAKAYSIGIWALALYEYVITFGDEVRQVWRKKFSFVTFLWIMNRYLMLFGFLPIEYFIFASANTDLTCENYIQYPAAMQTTANAFIGITLILRTYAIYGKNTWILVILIPALIAEVGLQIFVSTIGATVPLPPGFIGCIETGRADTGNQFIIFWICELVFPTLVFLLTLFRGFLYKKHGQTSSGRLFSVIMRDGVAYFFVIFLVNLTNVICYVVAPADLKAVNATLSALMTEIMICRLILNLRDVAGQPQHASMVAAEVTSTFVATERYDTKDTGRWTNRLIGNLGADVYNDSATWFDNSGDVDVKHSRQSSADYEMGTFVQPKELPYRDYE